MFFFFEHTFKWSMNGKIRFFFWVTTKAADIISEPKYTLKSSKGSKLNQNTTAVAHKALR